jgi:hypothetical protein
MMGSDQTFKFQTIIQLHFIISSNMVFWLALLQHEHIGGPNPPASWFEFAAKYHRAKLILDVSMDSSSTIGLIQEVVETRNSGFLLIPSEATDSHFVLHKFSPVFQYLSIITVTVRPTGNLKSHVELVSTSASFLPAWIPFVYIWSILGSWIPFPDFMCNRKYLIDFVNQIDRNGKKTPKEELSNASLYFFLFYIIIPILLVVAALLLVKH